MGIIQRQGAINSILTYVGFTIGFFNVILLFPHLLTKDQFGLTRLFIDLGTLLSGFAIISLPSVLYRFYPIYKKNNDYDLLYWVSICSVFGLLAVLCVMFFGKSWIIERYCNDNVIFSEYYNWLFVIVFMNVFITLFATYSNCNQKTVISIIVTQLFSRLIPFIALLIVFFFKISFDVFLVLFIATFVIQLLTIAYYVVSLTNFKNEFTSKLSRTTVRYKHEILLFGSSFLIITIVELISHSVQSITISHLEGIGNTAVFAVASYLAQVIQIPQRGVAAIATPIISEAWANNDAETINTIYKKSSLNLNIIGTFIFLCILCNINQLFDIIGANYKDGINVAIVMCIANYIDMSFGINNEIIGTSKFWKFNLITHVILLTLIIPTNYFFIKTFGVIGSAYSMLLSFSIYNLWRMIFLYLKFRFIPFSYKILLIIFWGICCYLIVGFVLSLVTINISSIIYLNAILRIAIVSSLLLLLFVLPIYRTKVSEDFNSLIDTAIHKVILRK